MSNVVRLGAALALVALLPACATMLAPRNHMVTIDTHPSGATVWLGYQKLGVTPCAIIVPWACPPLRLTLDGHHPRDIDLGLERDRSYTLGSVLLLGPFGPMIDHLTGKAYRVVDEPAWIAMAPEGEAAFQPWVRPGWERR